MGDFYHEHRDLLLFGNGEFVICCKRISKKIPDSSLIPMVSLLHKEVIQANGKSIGFIFSVHALTIPLAVKIFLKKIDISSVEYSFAIATRLGIILRDFKKIDKLLKKKNKQLDSIRGIIVNKKISREKDSDYLINLPYNRPVNYLLEKLVHLSMTFSEHTGGVNCFCADPKCTGCGICERVCLSQKIKMIDKKPVW